MSGVASTQNGMLTSNIGAQATSGLVGRTFGARLSDPPHVKDFGAVGNGQSNPISGVTLFGSTNTAGWTLAQWQTIYPLAQSLSDELDLLAFEFACANLEAGSQLDIGTGTYVFNRTLNVPNSINIKGGGCSYPGSSEPSPLPIEPNQGIIWVNHPGIGIDVAAAAVNTTFDGFGTFRNQPTPISGPPSAPTLSSVAGGTLAATTYYVTITYVNATGQTYVSAEASLAVAAGYLLSVASPPASAGATGWNVFVSTATGTETLQNSSPIPIGTAWTEPTTGLIAGSAMPLVDNSWAPATNGYDIVSNSRDTSILNFFIINATLGIQFLSSRPRVRNLRMTAYTVGIYSDQCYDVMVINGIHIYDFWAFTPGISNWTLNNLDAIYLLRNDNPQISDVFSLKARSGLRIGQSSFGTTSKFHLSNADFDVGMYAIFVDATVTDTTTGYISNISSESINSLEGQEFTQPAILIEGNNCILQFTNASFEGYLQSIVEITGTGNNVSFDNTVSPAFNTAYNWGNVANSNSVFLQNAQYEFGSGIQLGSNVYTNNPFFAIPASGNIELPGFVNFIQLSANAVLPSVVNLWKIAYFINDSSNPITLSVGTTGHFIDFPPNFGALTTEITLQPSQTLILFDRGSGEFDVIGGSWADANTAGAAISTLTVGASPYAYTASVRGEVIISGGTVTAVTLTRSGTTVTMPMLSGAYSMMAGDVLTVTYTAAPTMTFVPL